MGDVVPCQYVPSLRGGIHLAVVTTGGPGDIIVPIVFVIVFLALPESAGCFSAPWSSGSFATPSAHW